MERQTEMKPAYRVPSMAEIEAIPWNGYNVVSTFSGGGGSCLGYRLAGFNARSTFPSCQGCGGRFSNTPIFAVTSTKAKHETH